MVSAIFESVTGNIQIIEGRMNKEKYQDVLSSNLQESVEKLELSNEWIFQQDNNTKHTAKSIKKWLAEHNIEQFEWPSQSPDLNPNEN